MEKIKWPRDFTSGIPLEGKPEPLWLSTRNVSTRTLWAWVWDIGVT